VESRHPDDEVAYNFKKTGAEMLNLSTKAAAGLRRADVGWGGIT